MKKIVLLLVVFFTAVTLSFAKDNTPSPKEKNNLATDVNIPTPPQSSGKVDTTPPPMLTQAKQKVEDAQTPPEAELKKQKKAKEQGSPSKVPSIPVFDEKVVDKPVAKNQSVK